MNPQELWVVEKNETDNDKRWVVWAPTQEEALERVRMYLSLHYPEWYAQSQEPQSVRPLEFDAFGVSQIQ